MKKIIDEQGNIVQGLYRLDNGSIVVKDSAAWSKYMKQKQVFNSQTEKISNLESQVNELRGMFELLLKERK